MPKPLFRRKIIGLSSRSINFNEIFSIRTLQFQVNPFLTITQFMRIMIPILATQFLINENDIEIVECGQYGLEVPPELAPSLVISSTKLCERWGETPQELSFYVRRKNYLYPQLQNYRRSETNNINSEITRVMGECSVCFEDIPLSLRYQCSHGICSNCYTSCIQHNYIICPNCRSS